MPERTHSTTMRVAWQRFSDASDLAVALASELAQAVQLGVDARKSASLALAGGSTPGPAYEALNRLDLPWQALTLIATDERFVPADHELSNERMFRQSLCHAFSGGAKLFSLASSSVDDRPEEALPELTERAQALPPEFDVTLLGVGNDGHTASLFPDDPGLDALFETAAPIGIAKPSSQPTSRISLSARRLLATRSMIIAIRGEEKRSVLEAAIAEPNRFPTGRLLAQSDAPITVFWSP